MKKDLFKLFVFIVTLLVMQAGIGYITMPAEIKNFRKYINEGTDCLYFCDSVMRFYTAHDVSGGAIIDFMKRSGPKFSVEAVDHPAYNLDIYLGYCSAAVKGRKKPKAVIIPISLYSLSAEWMRPSYKFPLEQEALRSGGIFNTAFYRITASFKRKAGPAMQALDLKVYEGEKIAGKLSDFEGRRFETFTEENFRKKIISRYMYYAGPENEKIKSLQKIVETLKGTGVKAVFYIPPVDYEACSAAYGPEFMKTLTRNIKYIEGVCSGADGIFLDYSRLLKKGMFAWEETMYVNEHINSGGKEALASVLTKDMNKYLGGGK